MPMLDALRKGFHLFLLSFGISSPASSTAKKPRPAPTPAPKPDDSKP
jgi:hypothetical protein